MKGKMYIVTVDADSKWPEAKEFSRISPATMIQVASGDAEAGISRSAVTSGVLSSVSAVEPRGILSEKPLHS